MSATLATTALAAAHFAGPWVWGPWFLLIPLFWITVFVVLFLVFGRRWRRRNDPSRQAETTLAERYAKGDIERSNIAPGWRCSAPTPRADICEALIPVDGESQRLARGWATMSRGIRLRTTDARRGSRHRI